MPLGKDSGGAGDSIPGTLKKQGTAGCLLRLASILRPPGLKKPTQQGTLHPPSPAFVCINVFVLWGTFCPFIH